MRITKTVARLALVLIPLPLWGQFRCDLPDVYGVATIRGDRTYLAIWKHTDEKEILDIYAGLDCSDANRVAHFEDNGIHWQSLSAIEDYAVLGFQVRTTAGDDWFGATHLFMYDGKSFRKSFDSGETAEVVDLNGDGYPEVLEFVGGKGHPAGRVRVWIWRKGQFELLTTVSAAELYSAKVLSLLSSSSRAVTKRDKP